MKSRLLVIALLVSVSALGQVNNANSILNNIEESKTSLQFELSLPVIISQQSIIVEHRVFLNKKAISRRLCAFSDDRSKPLVTVIKLSTF